MLPPLAVSVRSRTTGWPGRAAGWAAPLAADHVAVVVEQMPVQREHKSQGVGAHLVDAIVGHVADRDAMVGRGLEIDHVHANAVARNDLAPPQRVDDRPADRRPLHHERIGLTHVRHELVGGVRVQPHQRIVKARSAQFGLFQLDRTSLRWYFPEFADASQHCRYADCTHTHEPVCGVKEAVLEGTIPSSRYETYTRLYAEPS